jgi:hypothetical protein
MMEILVTLQMRKDLKAYERKLTDIKAENAKRNTRKR